MTEWEDWTNERLIDREFFLYEEEIDDAYDNGDERYAIIEELRRRGVWSTN